MSGITNALLAQKMSELLDAWRTREKQMQDWIGGAADGGPYGDGTFPLADYLGAIRYTKSPAALESSVSGSAAASAASAAAAAASATAADTARGLAVTAQNNSTAARDAAIAARDLALSYRNDAANSEANALVYKNAAAASATAAAGSATDASTSADAAADSATAAAASAVAADASADAAAASAALAATFNPALFAALAGSNTFTADCQFTSRSFSAGGTNGGNARSSVAVQLGHSGAGYASIGINVVHTATSGVYNYGVADSAGLIDFDNGSAGWHFKRANLGTAGAAITFTTLASFRPTLIEAVGKQLIQHNDSWLRLNPNGDFTSGVYTAGVIRADNGVQVAAGYGIEVAQDTYGSITVNGTSTGYFGVHLPGPSGSTFMERATDGIAGIYQQGISTWMFLQQSGAFKVTSPVTDANSRPYLRHTNVGGVGGGKITVSTAAPSGTPADGDIWIQRAA